MRRAYLPRLSGPGDEQISAQTVLPDSVMRLIMHQVRVPLHLHGMAMPWRPPSEAATCRKLRPCWKLRPSPDAATLLEAAILSGAGEGRSFPVPVAVSTPPGCCAWMKITL